MDTKQRRQQLGELFLRDRDRLRSVALRILRDPTEAEDAVQDAFVSACRSLDSFRGQARLSTWLHRIVYNAALMRLRSRRRRRDCSLEADLEGSLQTGARAPDEEIAQRELCGALLRVASQLDARSLELLAARYLRDEPLRTIARRQRITPSAAKTRVHRARASLREMLEHSSLRRSEVAELS